MGEANRRRLTQKNLLASEPRCIYCSAMPTSLEHMPPITIFKNRRRPKGMVYACCANCNNRTSGADLVASFMARLNLDTQQGDWQLMENLAQRFALRKKAPGFLEELFESSHSRSVWRDRRGILTRYTELRAAGPRTRSYLNVFCAKFGMALYREHVGEALPLEGIVHTMWFTNAGLSQTAMNNMLRILPGAALLSQGNIHSGSQFSYRFNTDLRSIVAALAGFQQGLHVFVIATGTPASYPIPDNVVTTQSMMRAGQLVSSMPDASRAQQPA